MAAELPQFILLKSDAHKKYLCRSKQEQGSKNGAFLHFFHDVKAELPEPENAASDTEPQSESSERIELQYFKFEVEKAKTAQGFVHIRSCYNNKYWVRKSADSKLIVAEANEGEEDQSKSGCTLFKPVFLDSSDDDDDDGKWKKMHLLHLGQHQLGTSSLINGQLHLAVGDDPAEAKSSSDFGAGVLKVRDASAMALLPEYVALMGHDGRYFNTKTNIVVPENRDIGERGVAQRTSYSRRSSSTTDFLEHQEVYFIDQATGVYWTAIHQPFLMLHLQQIASSFTPIKVGDRIALRCPSINNMFARSSKPGPRFEALTVDSPTINETAMLRVAEPVVVREITHANYNLDDSRIYGINTIEKYVDDRSNRTSVEQRGTFQVTYKVSQTMSWNQSTTVNVGVKASWSAGIPSVGKLGLEISYGLTKSWAWGESETEEKTVQYTQQITIPPGRKVTLRVLAQRAYCDVPFSCKVRDLMTFGTLREYELTDGLYTGCNEYEFHTSLTEEDAN